MRTGFHRGGTACRLPRLRGFSRKLRPGERRRDRIYLRCCAFDNYCRKRSRSRGRKRRGQRWQCLRCGYIHEGPEPPDICPVCGAPKNMFVPIE
ncbi:rubredoxin-like domain-containing protein [Syntrophothermus lipocalidus]|uniref:rubredoxin-like domain-containing protein n=1 Tax=Syntrophothermus lipocalidus TaxID=86170 RepID=UPI003BF92812